MATVAEGEFEPIPTDQDVTVEKQFFGSAIISDPQGRADTYKDALNFVDGDPSRVTTIEDGESGLYKIFTF